MESLSPFLWGSCIPYNMPVYPGARRKTPKPRICPGECGPEVPIEDGYQPDSSQTTAYPEVLSPVPEALDATGQGYSICGDLAHRARHPRRHL